MCSIGCERSLGQSHHDGKATWSQTFIISLAVKGSQQELKGFPSHIKPGHTRQWTVKAPPFGRSTEQWRVSVITTISRMLSHQQTWFSKQLNLDSGVHLDNTKGHFLTACPTEKGKQSQVKRWSWRRIPFHVPFIWSSTAFEAKWSRLPGFRTCEGFHAFCTFSLGWRCRTQCFSLSPFSTECI